MNVSELWAAMEEEASKAPNQQWLMRLALPLPGCALMAAVHVSSKARALLLHLPDGTELSQRQLPRCAGLDVRSTSLNQKGYLEIRLKDAASGDVFAVLAQDVVNRIAGAAGPRLALEELLGRLSRWQEFLQIARDGLSIEAQRGIWGELHVMADHLVAALGPDSACEGWKAPSASHQDFQFAAGAIEVKTTIAKQPQSVRVTSERQLDETGVGALILWVVVLDEREVPSADDVDGVTLPAKVAAARAAVAQSVPAARAFEIALFERGWMDTQSEFYRDRRWAVRREELFHVRDGFPRIIESMLASGVGSVGYALSLAACEPFALTQADASRITRGMVPGNGG